MHMEITHFITYLLTLSVANGSMQISVRNSGADSGVSIVDVDPGASVKDLLTNIGVDAQRNRFVFQGRILNPQADTPVADAGIGAEAQIEVVPRKLNIDIRDCDYWMAGPHNVQDYNLPQQVIQVDHSKAWRNEAYFKLTGALDHDTLYEVIYIVPQQGPRAGDH
eukprot:296036_1